MDQPTSLLLGSLVLNRPVAALATTHDGKPFASMIPYAVLGLRTMYDGVATVYSTASILEGGPPAIMALPDVRCYVFEECVL